MNVSEVLAAQEQPAQHTEISGKPEAVDSAQVLPATASCANCAEPLLGPHCYACGQPAESLVRQLPELIGDFLNSVFGLDSRIARTLGPLFFSPGFLTNEYLAGRRVRYVSPVRLFVFLCLTAFFAAQLSSDWNPSANLNVQTGEEGTDNEVIALPAVERSIAQATTVAEVERLRDQALEEIAKVSSESATVPGLTGVMNGVEQIVRAHAQRRIAELEPVAAKEGGDQEKMPELQVPNVDGAPAAINAWMVRQTTKLAENIARIERDPNLLKDALFGAIPSSLFIMLPFFAVLLSLLYLFKRRLYMEHLIVALHSHAFLSLALLMAVILFDLRAWLTEDHTLPQAMFNLTLIALVLWMPVYLLVMQKRVYRQDWPATLVKFAILGTGYLALLGTAVTFTALASLVSL